MLARRIAASACALCLVVLAAGAVPAPDPPGSHLHHPIPVAAIATGDTESDLRGPELTGSRGDSQINRYNDAIAGDTKSSPSGAIAPATEPGAVSSASHDDGSNGWQIAAIIEAALLGARATTAAVLAVDRRRRVARVGA